MLRQARPAGPHGSMVDKFLLAFGRRYRWPQPGQGIFDLMLRIASGERSKSELLGLGDDEFVPWNIGVVS